MEKIHTRLDDKVNKELLKNVLLTTISFSIIGMIGIIIYIVLRILKKNNFILNGILFSSIVLFGFGILLSIIIIRNIKSLKNIDTVFEEEFFDDHILINNYRNGKLIETKTASIDRILYYKSTKNYYFLYINKFAAIPVFKGNNNDELFKYIKERNIRKKLF